MAADETIVIVEVMFVRLRAEKKRVVARGRALAEMPTAYSVQCAATVALRQLVDDRNRKNELIREGVVEWWRARQGKLRTQAIMLTQDKQEKSVSR